MDIKKQLLLGNTRAAARLITFIENDKIEGLDILKECYVHTGNAKIIGITGPPGAGKSTLTDKLAKEARKEGKKVGILAIDPSSPFSGGAILGDRVRMTSLSSDKGVFIRSMGSRGSLGGLSKSTFGAIKVLDILGMDIIFVETVGVGQSEIDIMKVAHMVVLVMVPGLGDDIQAIKAGILEIGNIFAVNKSDRAGADLVVKEISQMLDHSPSLDFRPEILKVIARDNIGISELFQSIKKYFHHLITTGLFEENKKKILKNELQELIKEAILKNVKELDIESNVISKTINDIFNKHIDPYTASKNIVNKFKNRGI